MIKYIENVNIFHNQRLKLTVPSEVALIAGKSVTGQLTRKRYTQTMITYFVHSTSFDNEKGVQSGWQDPELSLKGKDQALHLRELIAEEAFDLVIASDLQRAKQPAHIVFPDREVQYDERLREMNYGDLNGSYSNSFPENEMWCIENRFKNGECCLDVQARIHDFINSAVPKKAKVAIISHRYPQLAFEVIYSQKTWPEVITSDWRLSGAWQPGWTYK